MRKWFRYLFLTVVMAGMMSMAVAAGDWKPIRVEPVEGYYLVKESEAFWESGEIVGQLGFTYAYGFDADGNMSQRTTISFEESKTIETYSYDANGDCTKIVTVHYLKDGTEETSEKSFTYDANGDCTKIVTVHFLEDGTEVTFEERFIYDSDHRLVRTEDDRYTTTYVYNSLGQIAEKKVVYSYGEENSVYTYDSQGNLVSVNSTAVDVFDLSTKTTTTVTNYVYDSNGNCISERTRTESYYGNTGNTYIEGDGCDYYYDSQGRLSKYEVFGLSETDHSTYVGGIVLVYEYDAVGNNTKIYDYDDYGGSEERLMSTYEYTYEKLGPQPAEPDCDGGESCPGHGYTDLNSDAWYHTAVDYVLEKGYMIGCSEDSFQPEKNLSRAEMVQILYNMEGRPAVTGQDDFADTRPGAWYSDAVLWAAQNGIVVGYGNGLFGPTDVITREQMVSILYRYAEQNDCDMTTSADLSEYGDVGQVSSYAKEPFRWAVANAVVVGKPGNLLDSLGNASRAQAAEVILHYCENVE